MFFSRSHEWVSKDGFVGISAHAQKELGEVVYLQLPKEGTLLRAGQEACVLESTKAASDIYSPVSGKVIAINQALLQDLSLLQSAPESLGWLFQLELSNLLELSTLLMKSEYQKLLSF